MEKLCLLLMLILCNRKPGVGDWIAGMKRNEIIVNSRSLLFRYALEKKNVLKHIFQRKEIHRSMRIEYRMEHPPI